jgi:thiamine-monophosphate kinase
MALNGGDDYELCFSAPANKHQAVLAAGKHSKTNVTCIGKLDLGSGIQVHDRNGAMVSVSNQSFDHFTENLSS